MTIPKIFTVIVNWNGWKDTLRCLDSVLKIRYPEYRVIVIDNGSENNSAERIEHWIQQQKGKTDTSPFVLIRLKKNMGFAGGNNIGIKYALKEKANYVVLLNNDTVVPATLLENLLKVAEEDPAIGIVGCRILQMEGCDKIQHAAQRRIPWRGFVRKDLRFNSGVVEVNSVTGCIMFVNSKVFHEVGLLNEKYFMYMEDVDFCYRAQREGWKLKIDLDTSIWHRHSGSNKDNGFSVAYYSSRNRLYLISWQLKDVKRVTAIVSFHMEQLLRILRFALKGHFRMIAGVLLGNVDFLCGRDGPRR